MNIENIIMFISIATMLFMLIALNHRIDELTTTLDNKYPISIVRTANWTHILDNIYRCPHCGFTGHDCNEYKFCPKCGSKMEG